MALESKNWEWISTQIKWLTMLVPKSARAVVFVLAALNVVMIHNVAVLKEENYTLERKLEDCNKEQTVVVGKLKDEFLVYLMNIIEVQNQKNSKLDTLINNSKNRN